MLKVYLICIQLLVLSSVFADNVRAIPPFKASIQSGNKAYNISTDKPINRAPYQTKRNPYQSIPSAPRSRQEREPTLQSRSVRITSYPSGASVYIDEVYKGQTPYILQNIDYGEHTIMLTKHLHENKVQKIVVSQDTGDIAIRLVPIYGTLIVETDRAYSLTIDGIEQTTHTLNISQGHHLVEIDHPYIDTHIQYITIQRGDTLRLQPAIAHQARNLQFTAQPTEVDVYLYGKKIGTTPFVKRYKYDKYPFEAREGKKSVKQTIDMGNNATNKVQFNLIFDCDITALEEYAEISKSTYTRCLKKAQSGDIHAQSYIAEMYYLGVYQEQDYDQAAEWYTLATDSGHTHSQLRLATMYHLGQGVIQDHDQSRDLFANAGDKGNIDAQYALGSIYYSGDGVDIDYALAYKWFHLAAEQGHPAAQYGLGTIYLFAKGVEADYNKAIKWYTASASQGNADAQYGLATMYLSGIGLEQHYAKALAWFYKSAKQNNPKALYKIGQMYEQGLGIPKDMNLAQVWYEKSAELGYAKAIDKLTSQ